MKRASAGRIRARLSYGLRAGVLACLLAGVLPLAAGAVPGDERLDAARDLFQEARYDSARALLVSVTGDEALPVPTRQEAYRLLGLVQTVMGDYEPARSSIESWISLAPAEARVDPDRDMLEFVHLYYEVRKSINEREHCPAGFTAPDPCQYGQDQPDPGIRTLAVLDFDNNAVDQRERLAPLGGGLADLMIRQLNGAVGLQLVEREQLRWMLDELDLTRSGRVDPETAVRVGRLMGAHAVLLGDYLYFNDELHLGARLVKVETGEILLTAQESGDLENFADVAGRLSTAIAEAVGAQLERKAWQGRTPTNRLEALLAFAEGLAAYDRGHPDAAADKFREALRHDPGYEPALRKMQAIRPLLVARTGSP